MEIFEGITKLLIIVVFEVLLVTVAMSWDFASGYHKAKLRGEKRNSYGMKRTVSKFILYFGSMTIALGIDCICFVCKFFDFIHLPFLMSIPVFASILSIFIMVIELRSILEKAEDKARRQAEDAVHAVSGLMKNELLKTLVSTMKEKEEKHESE